MNRKINLLRIFMTTQLNYIPMGCIILVGTGIMGAVQFPVVPMLFLGMLPFVLYFVRIYSKGILSFGLGHILSAGLWYFIFMLVDIPKTSRNFFVLFLIFFIILSCYYRGAKEDREEEIMHPAVGVGIMTILYFVQQYFGNIQFQRVLIVTCGIYLCLFWGYTFIEHYLTFIYVNKRGAGVLSEKQVFLTGGVLAFGYTLFAGILFQLFAKESLGVSLGGYLKEIFLRLLRWFFSRFAKAEEDLAKMEENVVYQEESFIPQIKQEPNLLLETIGKIMEVLFYCALAFFIAVLIIWVIRSILQIFRTKQEMPEFQEEKENLIRSVRQKRKEKETLPLPFTAKGKIRKYYYSYVKKQGKINQIQYETARELCSKETKTEEESAKILCEIYERARYSNLECNEELVRNMRKAVSILERENKKVNHKGK